jgi:hypothetical protein
MKLRITIDGNTYDAEVEILETEESGPHFNRMRRLRLRIRLRPFLLCRPQPMESTTVAVTRFVAARSPAW